MPGSVLSVTQLEEIRKALRCGRLGCPCRSPRGNLHCPAHDDEHPSLSIDVRNGRLVWRCHAGCSQAAVAHALRGLGLLPEPGRLGRETRYTVRDVGGRVVAIHVRRDQPGGGKEIWWELPDGRRGLHGRRVEDLPLYAVERLGGAKWVIVAEGEKAADALLGLGLPAVGTVCGANGTPGDESLRPLVGRMVYLWPDNDEAGRAHMARVAERLAALGCRDVRRVNWRDAPPKGDAADFVAAGGSAEGVLRLMAEAEPWAPDSPAPELPQTADGGTDESPAPPAWPEPLNDAAYYGLAGEVVRALSPHTEADPIALLLSFLAAFGACLGPSAYCEVGADRHPLKIWPILVGATAKGRKGSSWAPIRELFRLVDPAFAETRIVSGLSSGEGLIWAVRDPLTGRERAKDGVNTRYVEVEIDPGVADKRLLVLEEEFSAPLRVLARDGNTLSPVLRQAWDRGDLRILTKNSPARATGAHVVVVGHAVAEEVRRYLRESEMAGGFGNRFLWICVRRSRYLPRGAALDPSRLTTLADKVRRALEVGRTLGRIDWSEEAGQQWDAIYPELSEGKPGLFGAVVARMEAQALRLAGLYAALDGSRRIAVPHLHAALAVVDYAEASARWLFGEALGDPVADAVLDALRRNGPMSRTEIFNLFGRHVSRDRIAHALRTLQAMGLATTERLDTGGRPMEVWQPCRG